MDNSRGLTKECTRICRTHSGKRPNDGGGLEIGDRVVLESNLACGYCDYCRTGYLFFI